MGLGHLENHALGHWDVRRSFFALGSRFCWGWCFFFFLWVGCFGVLGLRLAKLAVCFGKTC